ncbi:protein neprosin-like [Alnus glutinosa]|nr:protein neprosin-like [Alnus glutinosa]XP_062162957.1 protein neprosin-like [Alnus glutinosa]
MSDKFVGGRRIGTIESKKIVKHKGTVKTIEGNNGDVIDCVDIYQQPAFDHPLLKNHTIQMEPSSIPNVTNGELYDDELFQGLLENEECPEGTIPIRHAREDEYYPHRAIPPAAHRKNLNVRVDYDTTGHEYAGVRLSEGNYHGASAFINVWNPTVNDDEVSIAQIWLTSGPSDLLNTIEAGWIVSSTIYIYIYGHS